MKGIRTMDTIKVLEFPTTAGFGKWRKFFPREAVAHPAKMNLYLLDYLIKTYTKEGDLILDPMAGSGSTGVLAVLNNRNAICVDIEDKFVKWMKGAKEIVEKTEILIPKGRMIVIQGDARRLSELLKEHREDIDEIITSPPFGESNQYRGGTQNKERMMKGNRPAPYSNSEDNVGNLRYGNVDEIITSPPYEGSLEGTSRHGVPIGYSPNPKSDEVEYEALDETIKRLRRHGRSDPKAGGPYGRSLTHPYSPNPKNIGNMKKKTYLEAMLKVYQECHKILKPNGLLIVVIKNFVRNKKLVPLHEHTIKLCELAGFKLIDHLLFKLPTVSFWRILMKRKGIWYDDLNYEHVLIFISEPHGGL